jgi:tetratricopeptide (TPR) repeat protein
VRRTLLLAGTLAALSLVLIAFSALVLTNYAGYGSPDDLARRIKVEYTSRLPHPDFVPTPATSRAGLRLASLLGPTASATGAHQEATVTPTPSASASPTPVPAHTASPAPSATVSDSPTPRPSVTPSASPVPSTSPTPPYTPASSAVALKGATHAWQTWNNCGPATLSMNLSYFGSKVTQADVAAVLRPDKDDKNVSPDELTTYARGQGYRALVRANGDAGRLRLLLSNGIPVIVETWHEPKPNDGMGHYRLLMGYDDASREWIAYDSYDGKGLDFSAGYTGIRMPYDEFERLWKVFHNVYIIIYPQEEAGVVAGILGSDVDDRSMWEDAQQASKAALQSTPQDPFLWFNLGTDLVAAGRFGEAAEAYDQARQIGLPWRMLWYQFGPFRAYYESARYDEVISLADATLKIAKNVEELYYWKGMALQAKGDLAGAQSAWEEALKLNPGYGEPAQALAAAAAQGRR